MKQVKITELIKDREDFSYSFEVTPDISEEELVALKIDPLFYSVTWHAKSHQCRDLNIPPLKTASHLRFLQKNVLLHLSCDFMKEDYLLRVLSTLQRRDICNLFIVLGEDFDPETSDFHHTSEMVHFIREKTGNYFCIGVAAYPGSTDERMVLMKVKVNLGADFVITQAFYDTNAFVNMTQQCEKLKIRVPIIPGIFAFESLEQLKQFINMCKIKVSKDLLEAVENTEKMEKPCSEIIKNLIQELYSKCNTTHFHFFTLNKLQKVESLMEQIKIDKSDSIMIEEIAQEIKRVKKYDVSINQHSAWGMQIKSEVLSCKKQLDNLRNGNTDRPACQSEHSGKKIR